MSTADNFKLRRGGRGGRSCQWHVQRSHPITSTANSYPRTAECMLQGDEGTSRQHPGAKIYRNQTSKPKATATNSAVPVIVNSTTLTPCRRSAGFVPSTRYKLVLALGSPLSVCQLNFRRNRNETLFKRTFSPPDFCLACFRSHVLFHPRLSICIAPEDTSAREIRATYTCARKGKCASSPNLVWMHCSA